jgi:hypothetical protein
VSFVLLVGGGVLLVTFLVGSTAAGVGLLVYIAHLFAFLFGVEFRWGLVTACALLVAVCATAGLVHDLRLEISAPEPPPKEHV